MAVALQDGSPSSALLQQLDQRKKSLIASLQHCGSLEEGRQLHAEISRCVVLRSDHLLLNLLVKMYSDHDRLDAARSLFDRMPRRNVFSWNILLGAYARKGHLQTTESFFHRMPYRDVVSWNTMIQVYSRIDFFYQAVRLLSSMDLDGVSPDRFSIAPLLSCCPSLAMAELILAVSGDGGIDVGCRHVATELIKLYGRLGQPGQARNIFHSLLDSHKDAVALATMITVAANGGQFSEALRLFHEIEPAMRNTGIWNAIISACARNGRTTQALALLATMDMEGDSPVADSITLVSAIQACSTLEELRTLHSLVETTNSTEVKTALVDAYGSSGSIAEARRIFDGILAPDIIAWTSMITVYSRNRDCRSAIQIFQTMQLEGSHPNPVTLSSVFHACSVSSSLPDTLKIHKSLSGESMELDTVVANALMDAYRSCGAIDRVAAVFDRMPLRNVVSWSSMVAAFAQCGRGSDCVARFRAMDLEGVAPNEVTFVSIIHACSHGGLLEDGRLYFVRMIEDYGIQPGMDHLACLIDLFGRSGKMDEAKEIAAFYSLDVSELRIIQL